MGGFVGVGRVLEGDGTAGVVGSAVEFLFDGVEEGIEVGFADFDGGGSLVGRDEAGERGEGAGAEGEFVAGIRRAGVGAVFLDGPGIWGSLGTGEWRLHVRSVGGSDEH